MSNKIIMFPVGGEVARKHYEDSVEKTANVGDFSEFLSPESLDKIYYGPNKKVALWGMSSTHRLDNIYNVLNNNDLVLFVQDKKIISFAMVLMKIQSSLLSEKNWQSNEWSNIIFLTEVKNLENVSTLDMWKFLGYMDNFILRGPLIIKSDKSNAFLRYNEEVNQCLEKWIKDSEEIRPKTERNLSCADNFNPKIFISYAHSDEKYKEQLTRHLTVLLNIWRAGEIWDDRNLEPGIDYNEQISKHLEEANICILLISSDYFYSKYCMKEFDKIIKSDQIIIPIVVRSCYWEKLFTTFEKSIITFPQNGANIFACDDKDEEYKKIVQHIDETIEKRLKNEDEN